jgi:CRP-like cAMP-binding protein
MSGSFSNTILRALDQETVARLHLNAVKLELNHEMEFPGTVISHLYFVEEGMASQTVTFKDGFQVEVGMFGYESVIGISALMGTKESLNRVYTQIPGHGFSCTLGDARKEFDCGGLFQELALRYVQAQLVQAMQSAGCNARHGVQERLARWLLICADRAHSDSFTMPHEFLAEMIGNTRSAVRIAAGSLKDAGVIEYTRGKIRIVDNKGLEKMACECYSVIKNHLDNYAEIDGSSPR